MQRRIRFPKAVWLSMVCLSEAIGMTSTAWGHDTGLDRTVLPNTELDVRNAKAPLRFVLKAPKDAPNVVVVLLDDTGFGHPGRFGGPMAFNHFHAGWAIAGDTPFQWTMQAGSHFGGTRNTMVVHWGKGIKAKSEVRSQFHHVIDIAPTVRAAS